MVANYIWKQKQNIMSYNNAENSFESTAFFVTFLKRAYFYEKQKTPSHQQYLITWRFMWWTVGGSNPGPTD